ncbi:MAG TPA: YdcF family protein [Chloroflexota bacterium]|nr:YdcF family protein [Chloroflexota bacterium]
MRRLLLMLMGLGLLAAVLVAYVALYQAVERQAVLDETRNANAAIVLGAAVEWGGRPSPSLRVRTQHAIALYRAGRVKTLFLTGGLGRHAPSEAEVMKRLALAAGVPEEALVLDETATSTQESIAAARAAAQVREWETVLVVSEPFHMLRVRQMAQDVGLDAYASPARGSAIQRIERLRRFYTAREAAALLWYLTLGRLVALG